MRIQKICFCILTNISFIFLKDFAWTTPKKYQITDYNP